MLQVSPNIAELSVNGNVHGELSYGKAPSYIGPMTVFGQPLGTSKIFQSKC